MVDLSNRCSLAATLNVLSLTDIAEAKVTINDDNRKWWAPIKYRGTLHKFSISEDSDNDSTSMTLTSVSTTSRITIIGMFEYIGISEVQVSGVPISRRFPGSRKSTKNPGKIPKKCHFLTPPCPDLAVDSGPD